MAIPVSASITQLNAEVFLQEGYELSLDAIVPSIELTGSFSPTVSKTQFYIYSYSKTLLYENLNYNAEGSYLEPASGTTISNSSFVQDIKPVATAIINNNFFMTCTCDKN